MPNILSMPNIGVLRLRIRKMRECSAQNDKTNEYCTEHRSLAANGAVPVRFRTKSAEYGRTLSIADLIVGAYLFCLQVVAQHKGWPSTCTLEFRSIGNAAARLIKIELRTLVHCLFLER